MATTPESRAEAARTWAQKLAPLVQPDLTLQTVMAEAGVEKLEVLGLALPDQPYKMGKCPDNGYFMLGKDLFGERVLWWESPPADLIHWITREEASELLGIAGTHRSTRLRNYEFEMELRSKGLWDHYIGESCPFDAHWTRWGSMHPDGVETNRLYDERTKALYSLVDCPHCSEHFGGYGEQGARWNGPHFDGTCQGWRAGPPTPAQTDLDVPLEDSMRTTSFGSMGVIEEDGEPVVEYLVFEKTGRVPKHENLEETFRVISGNGCAAVHTSPGGRPDTTRLVPGSELVIPPNTHHTMWPDSGTALKAVLWYRRV